MISVGDKQAVLYRGDQRPASLYRGGNQITGYKLVEQIGTLLSFDGSYNDQIEGLSAKGESSQKAGVQGTNLISNGDFSQGANGWSSLYGTISVNAGVLSLTASAQYGRTNVTLPSSCQGHKVYRAAMIKANSALVYLGRGSGLGRVHSGGGNYEHLSFVQSSENVLSTSIIDMRTGGWDLINVKYVIAVDLTATFGAGNEPTAEQIDAMLSQHTNSWFNSYGWLTVDAGYVPNSPSPDYPSAITPVTGDIIVSDGTDIKQTLALTDLNGIAAAGVYDTFEPYVIVDGVPRSRKTQRVSAYTFTGTETISVGVLTNTVQVGFYITDRMPNTPVICTHLMLTQDATDKEHVFGSIASPSVCLHIAKTRLSSFDVAGVKAYLAAQKAVGIPVTVYYALATPVVTLGAPVVIPTYPGQTIISAPAQITASARVRI